MGDWGLYLKLYMGLFESKMHLLIMKLFNIDKICFYLCFSVMQWKQMTRLAAPQLESQLKR